MTHINLNQIFAEARTHNVWLDKPVADDVLKQVYETMEWGPTSVNCLPARIVYVKPGEWKNKLLETLMPANVEKTRAAPVTAILAYDAAFFDQLPKLFPQADVKSWFSGNEAFAKETAQYNAALQHGYFILAARAHGLDVGPMAGFNKDAVDEAFFKGSTWKSSLLVNLGYGDASKIFPRNPRLSFAEAAQIRS